MDKTIDIEIKKESSCITNVDGVENASIQEVRPEGADDDDDSRRLIDQSTKYNITDDMGADRDTRGRSQRRRHFGACLKTLCIGSQFPESETSSEGCEEHDNGFDMLEMGDRDRAYSDNASDCYSPLCDTLNNELELIPDIRDVDSDMASNRTDMCVTADRYRGNYEINDCYSEEGYESCPSSSHDSLEAISLCLEAMKVESEANSLNVVGIEEIDYALQLSSPTQEDREFHFLKNEIRRSTSLKSGKTPPGTPRKKVVRFADALGLDLASVRHILDTDKPPNIPQSAIDDLKVGLEEELKTQGCRHLAACFQQPGAEPNFIDHILKNKVCLENTLIDGLTVTGSVRVSNLSLHKAVNIRMTSDGWNKFFDIPASYVQNSCDGATDRFAFTLIAPCDFSVGGKIHFAIAFTCGGVTYWDNNHGTNYTFECYAKSYPSATHLSMTFV